MKRPISKTINTSGLPDFIIIGAMKSGTTSIHHILSQHDGVFIPDSELYFFDVDDIVQHPDFFILTESEWTYHDFEKDFDQYLEWYKRFFADARPGQLIGEDTTTYLASSKAPERIGELLPNVKLIAMLRDPVARVYSHYWHNVSAGRVTKSFDATLRLNGGNYLSRGYYLKHLRRYESFIAKGNLKVILFEEFLKDKQAVIDELCSYLGLEGSVDVTSLDSHKNRSSAPFNLSARLFSNRIYRLFASTQSNRDIPNMPNYSGGTRKAVRRPPRPGLLTKFGNVMGSRLPKRKYPPMRRETRVFLEKIYRSENMGLSELIGKDVSEYWEYMKP